MATTPDGCAPAPLWPVSGRTGTLRPAMLGLLLLGLWLGSAGVSAAQSAERGKPDKPYALIFGTVWGPDDQPLYGVKVKLRRDQDKKPRWEIYSDHHGEFAQRVPAGQCDYVIWADLKGYKAPGGKPLQGDEIKVHVDNDERADVGLHLK
jgi:hypothetical protein